MSDIKKLQSDIEKLNKAISSSKTKPELQKKLKAQLSIKERQLDKAKGVKRGQKRDPYKEAYKRRVTQKGVPTGKYDIEKDSNRPALPAGKRIARKSGKTYYERRDNRIDVKQPPVKRPKLAQGGAVEHGLKQGDEIVKTFKDTNLIKVYNDDKFYFVNLQTGQRSSPYSAEEAKAEEKVYADGGMLGTMTGGVDADPRFDITSPDFFAKGGSVSAIRKAYDENEDNNDHSENVVLLARHFGTKEDLEEAKSIQSGHNRAGHLTEELRSRRDKLAKKLYPKFVAMEKLGGVKSKTHKNQ